MSISSMSNPHNYDKYDCKPKFWEALLGNSKKRRKHKLRYFGRLSRQNPLYHNVLDALDFRCENCGAQFFDFRWKMWGFKR